VSGRAPAIARALGLAVVSGLLLLLAFPPFGRAALAWIALVPLVLQCRTPRSGFLLSGVTGLVFFVGIFSWIWTVPAFNLLDGILVAAYLGLYFAGWGMGVAWLHTHTRLPLAAVAPPLWVALEYVRGHAGFLSLPWMLLGYSQYEATTLIQISAVTGVYGVSFLVVLVNASVADALSSVVARDRDAGASRWRPVVLALAIPAVVLTGVVIHGRAVLSDTRDGGRVTIAVVQGNVPQALKWDAAYRQAVLERYARLTREAARHAPTLIVWPETAAPGDVRHDPTLQRLVGGLAVETGTHLLVGGSEHAKFARRELHGKFYNSLFLVTPRGQIEAEYRKIRLVPFGEYEPLQGWITWPRAIAAAVGTSVAGTEPSVLRVGELAFGATICWENLFPELVREFVKAGARVMVNATNEAWFGESSASAQFLAISALRAAENRVAIARATNTGISAFIDPFGRVGPRLRGPDGRELFVEGHLVAELPVSTELTFYTRHGDVFALVQLAGSAALLVQAAFVRGAWRGSPSGRAVVPHGIGGRLP
jgi:apolipoprotein N-acyltransferase